MSTRGPGTAVVLDCPICGAVLNVKPSVAPGLCWVAVLPCPSCRVYAAHVVTPDGIARSRLLDRAPTAAGAGGSG
jgi:hypothetical protein